MDYSEKFSNMIIRDLLSPHNPQPHEENILSMMDDIYNIRADKKFLSNHDLGKMFFDKIVYSTKRFVLEKKK